MLSGEAYPSSDVDATKTIDFVTPAHFPSIQIDGICDILKSRSVCVEGAFRFAACGRDRIGR